MREYFISALLSAMLITPTIKAQDKDERIPVRVTATCDDDSVGQRLVYRTREEIRSSRRMKYETEYLDSVVQVRIVCLTPRSDDAGIVSKYAYVITALNSDGDYDYLISHVVGECGSSRVDSCAENIAAEIDNAIDDLIDKVKNGRFKFDE